jgi:hypothetical protein
MTLITLQKCDEFLFDLSPLGGGGLLHMLRERQRGLAIGVVLPLRELRQQIIDVLAGEQRRDCD